MKEIINFIEDVCKEAECEPIMLKHLERLGYSESEISEKFNNVFEFLEEYDV